VFARNGKEVKGIRLISVGAVTRIFTNVPTPRILITLISTDE
jgi:hypothetical protein